MFIKPVWDLWWWIILTLSFYQFTWVTNIRGTGQNGGVGWYVSLPYTTKRRIRTNWKTENNHNCQKIKLYGSPTTKAAGRLGKARWWLEDQAGPHLCADKPEGTTGELTVQPRVPEWETIASKPLAVKTCADCNGGRNSQCHGRVLWRVSRDPGMYTSLPTHLGISIWKGIICLWEIREVMESGVGAEQASLFLLWPLPPTQHHRAAKMVAPPWWICKALTLTT